MPGIDEAYRRMTAFDLKHGSRSLLRRLFTNLPTPFKNLEQITYSRGPPGSRSDHGIPLPVNGRLGLRPMIANSTQDHIIYVRARYLFEARIPMPPAETVDEPELENWDEH